MTTPPRSIDAAGGREPTIRSMLDCLIAAVAIRQGIPVLHSDRDFDALARHTELRVYEDGAPS